jgi:galactokinase
VEAFMEHGATGARLTGAGFGGCVIALVPRPGIEPCLTGAMRSYEIRTRRHPTGFEARATAGARIVA